MNRWFTADTHFYHENLIEYENRPFANANEMTEKLIQGINQRVKPEDEVYFLGDFVFFGGYQGGKVKAKDIEKRLNGKWIFVRGNHDNNNSLNTKIIRMTLEISGLKINCVHDPMNCSVYHPLNIVGHVHGAWLAQEYCTNKKKSLLINVGVEQWGYKPVAWNEIFKLYTAWQRGRLKVKKFDKEALKRIRKTYKTARTKRDKK